jgi:hypothetical protein
MSARSVPNQLEASIMEIRKLMRVARRTDGRFKEEYLPPVTVKFPYKYENKWRTKYPEHKPNR